MNYRGTYDGKIFHNPSNKFCIVIVKTADTSIPEQARDKRRYKDHLIRFTAVGYEIASAFPVASNTLTPSVSAV